MSKFAVLALLSLAVPQNLTEPFVTSTNFKKQRDAAGFQPGACSAG